MSISDILQNMPMLMEYFIPGYLATVFYKRLGSGSDPAPSEKIRIGTAVCLSTFFRFVLKTIYHWLISFPCFAFLIKCNTAESRFFIECLLLLLVTYAFYWFLKMRIVRKCYAFLTKTTLSNSVFESCDLKTGCFASIYLSDKVIRGRILVYDLAPNDQWIALDQYIVKDESGKIFDNWMYHQYERYLVPIKEIRAIVIHYSDGDKMIPTNYLDRRLVAQDEERNGFFIPSIVPKKEPTTKE